MRVIRSLFGIVALFCCPNLFGQPPHRFYTKFGGDGDDVGYSVKLTLDRNYIVAGSSTSYFSKGASDAFIVKVDTMGFPMWHRWIGGAGVDVAKSIIVLPDSGFVFTGYSGSTDEGDYDIYVVRLDKNGNTIWERTWEKSGWQFGTDLVMATDGILRVVGFSDNDLGGGLQGVLLKYSLSGDFLGEKIYGGNFDDEFRSIIITNDSLLAIAGVYSHTSSDKDLWFLKINLDGDTVFTRYFGSAYLDHANDIVQKQNSDYILCGAITPSLNSKKESYIVEIDSYGSKIRDMFETRSKTEDEEFISTANSFQRWDLTGYVRTAPFFGVGKQVDLYVLGHDLYAYRINDNGGNEDEEAFCIEGTPDGGFVIVGSTKSFNSNAKDVYLMKYDSTFSSYTSVVDIIEHSRDPSILVCNEKLNVNVGEEYLVCVEIISLSGDLIKKEIVNGSHITIDLSGHYGEIVLCAIRTERSNYFQKVLVR